MLLCIAPFTLDRRLAGGWDKPAVPVKMGRTTSRDLPARTSACHLQVDTLLRIQSVFFNLGLQALDTGDKHIAIRDQLFDLDSSLLQLQQ